MMLSPEVTETSSLLNAGLNGRDLAKAFDTPDFNVMIAANKYQTGFDQPKLCAMYVDKKLHGVDCVQTLSRLNRTFPAKKPLCWISSMTRRISWNPFCRTTPRLNWLMFLTRN